MATDLTEPLGVIKEIKARRYVTFFSRLLDYKPIFPRLQRPYIDLHLTLCRSHPNAIRHLSIAACSITWVLSVVESLTHCDCIYNLFGLWHEQQTTFSWHIFSACENSEDLHLDLVCALTAYQQQFATVESFQPTKSLVQVHNVGLGTLGILVFFLALKSGATQVACCSHDYVSLK